MTLADPELIALASDIGVLSRFISTTRPDWSERTLRTMTIPPLLDDNQLEPFSHISNLLSAESDAVVAVVGTITQENVIATIMWPAELESSERSRPITPSGRDWEDILYHEPASTAPEGYIADLLALVAALHANKLRGNTMVKWVLQRNRLKFQRRLERSRKDFFYRDLFDILERWSPAESDKIPSEAISVFGPDRLSGFYLKYGWIVHPVNEATGKFQLTKDTAALLINTIGKICKEVRQVVEDASFNWLAADSTSLVDALVLLGMILNQKPVEDLFTRTSLSVLLLPREHAESISQARADGWDPLTADDCNLYGHYALRYMRMLMSWPRAIFRFCAPSLQARLVSAKVTVVSLFDSPRIVDQAACGRATQSVIDETMHHLTPLGSKACDAALKWIQNLAAVGPEESACRIHAEAGAMALASKAWSYEGRLGQDDRRETFLGTTDGVEICTSQKCCLLCSRLGELLDYHYDSLGFEFMLPVTHDVVLPWDPPLFGIPKSVLKQLRDELRDKLVHLAVELGKENAHATGIECT